MEEDLAYFRERADHYRRLAEAAIDAKTRHQCREMEQNYRTLIDVTPELREANRGLSSI